MGSLFAKKEKPAKSRVTEQDRAILQVKQQKDKMKQYLKRLEGGLEKNRLLAKTLIQEGKKDRALLLLRKKRFQEQLITRALGQLDNLEQMITNIEQAQMELEVVQTLDAGNQCLKDLHRLCSVEDVEKIMEETRESVEYQREIDELISGSLTDTDEAEIMSELDQLLSVRKESKKAKKETEDAALELPTVPNEPIAEIPGNHPSKEKSAQKVALAAS